MNGLWLRDGEPSDTALLEEMLAMAAAWSDPEPPALAEVVHEGRIERYADGLGGERDVVVVAQIHGDPVGAAWYRCFPADLPGYAFVDAETPEVTIAVRPDRRGRGVGRALLEGLIERAHARGVTALSLSVAENNPASRLYRSVGFVEVELVGGSWTMVLDASASSA